MPRFDLEQFLKLIQKYSVTLSHIVPPIVLKLARDPLVDQYDLSSLKMIFSGAAPLGPDLSRECVERIGCGIRQGYGMAESLKAPPLASLMFIVLGLPVYLILSRQKRTRDEE